MRKIFWFKVFPVLIIGLMIFILNKYSWQGNDVLVMNIIGDKVEIINVSPARGMVNSYEIKNIDVWIPNGMGWYPISRLGLIVKDDDQLASRVIFYNFGFWPQHVLRQQDWKTNKSLLSMLGPVGWIRYYFSSEDWLWKDDLLKTNNLSEIMPRDLADNQILTTDVKLNIVNATGKNGFGNMIADRLEWWGITVTSVQTSDLEKECRLYFDFKSKEKFVVGSLSHILNCVAVDRKGGVELVLGTNLEEMVKYSQTYVRSF